MRKLKTPQTGTLSVDDIEAAFYDALQNGDIEKLMACWSDEDETVCVHPSGSRQLGPAAIRGAFEAMFSNGSIRARPVKVRKLDTLSACVHSVIESIEVLAEEGPRHVYAIATNVYHQTAQGWRMVAHHASPGSAHDLNDDSDLPQVLH